jgi:hypothetical protein
MKMQKIYTLLLFNKKVNGDAMIQSTAFGTINIDGVTYTSDVIIFPDGSVQDGWWRQRGHVLRVDDILTLVDTAPELIVIGTGASGRMRPDAAVKPFLEEKKIGFIAESNPRAMDVYNDRLKAGVKVGAGFHLTC